MAFEGTAMANLSRREFLGVAAALGAQLVWSRKTAAASTLPWRERRDLYAEGVASAEPDSDSVILWTRRPFEGATEARLTVEVAEDVAFTRVVSQRAVTVSAESDWTCRVLAAGLKPATEYWYRFVDDEGNGSRIGRTLTAPRERDGRPVHFAFVSCQSVNEGAQNAYRRMIHEDEKAPRSRQLGFVLHLGDFIYEVVEYPDEVKTRYDRTIHDVGRIPDSRKVLNFHVPTTLEGYRHVYRAYLRDPDIQDARARFPFVCMWDNHEFSWQGWQSNIRYGGKIEPAQALKVAANQAWFEYVPARIRKASGPGLERFDGPKVVNAPIETHDDDGLGTEPNNLKAIGSLTAYRTYRHGRHVEILITDLFSYRMQDQTGRPEAETLDAGDFLGLFPEEAMQIIDGGRAYADGKPPDAITVGKTRIDNYRKHEAPVTLLGRTQKAWFKSALARSRATWKVWAATSGTLDWRADPQNLPEGLTAPWPSSGYAGFGGGDFGSAHHERAELYDFIRDQAITGFAVVSGDRHSFWAGYAAKALPPKAFEPVGVAFITGSISAPGLAEALEHKLKEEHPLRALFVAEPPGGTQTEATVNLTLHRGVRSALEYARSGDIAAARALTNPDMAPHLEFVDMGGHGYSVVSASADAMRTEFVCIPRPIHRSTSVDGGPLRYRVMHTAKLWKSGEKPRLEQKVVEGDAHLST
jgi:alkaline phosphatase D